MKLKLTLQAALITAVIAIYPSVIHAAPWTFQSVRSYGAVGDGATNDKPAIDAAIAAGSVIYFPPGTYKYPGQMTLPANKSFRLYGDGPRVSTILFTGAVAGINAFDMKDKALGVDGLTLKAGDVASSGTALYANFNSAEGVNTKFRTATIRNVEIVGSDTTNDPISYWTNGISLYRAQNALIDDVQVHGKFNFSNNAPTSIAGITWSSSATYAATQVFLTNIYVNYFQKGIATGGHVEGLYLSGFELVYCGGQFAAAMDLTGGYPPGNIAVPVFHIVNGHVDFFGTGVKMSNVVSIKISNVNFFNEKYAGASILLDHVGGGKITECDFAVYNLENPLPVADGISLVSSGGVRIVGNSFGELNHNANGYCVRVDAASSYVRILDNQFGSSILAGQKYNVAPGTSFIRED